MSELKRPMKGCLMEDWAQLRYPLMPSVKLDGIRALVQGGVVLSKNLKPLANRYLQARFGRKAYEGLDGELGLGNPTDPDFFRRTQSATSTLAGEPDLTFHVFDYLPRVATQPYRERYLYLERNLTLPHTKVVKHTLVQNRAELEGYYEAMLALGHEGLMLRAPGGLYKHGESTPREGWLWKLKPFEYDDAEVLEVIEKQHNLNPATLNAMGLTERSSHKENKVGLAAVGAFRCRGATGPYKGKEFYVGKGTLTDEQAAALWAVRESLPGHLIEYKYFPTGSKDLPRFPGYFGPAIPGKHS